MGVELEINCSFGIRAARRQLPEVPSEVFSRQLPMRIALRQNGLVRSPAGCETGFWDKIPHKRKKVIEEARWTVAREGGGPLMEDSG